MIALAIESSNLRGMGHLFRSLLYVDYLKTHSIPYCYFINSDAASEKILEENNINYYIVDYADTKSNWEAKLIREYNIQKWFNDKYETSETMGRHIKETKTEFYTIDDVGQGEYYADISFCGMLFPSKKQFLCKRVFKGVEYVILNPEIEKYKRKRTELHKIIVTLGGSDTYGATVEVIEEMKKYDMNTDILIGPNFLFQDRLNEVNKGKFRILQYLPSLIKSFEEYDFAITGGGGTCCEAMASGLPCLVIANEPHEENTGRFYEEKGGCIYAGKCGEWNRDRIKSIFQLDISKMSEKGMEIFDTNAVNRIFEIIFSSTFPP